MLRALAAFVAAVLVAYALAAVAQTQHVMSRLADMGMDVGLGDRITTTLHDFVGMAPLYLPIIAIAFAIALPVAAGVLRFAPRWRPLGYPLAGGVAILAIHVILNQLFDITPIAAARTTLGLTTQALCGAVGGWLFGRLVRPSRT
jgi:hypothetical protein